MYQQTLLTAHLEANTYEVYDDKSYAELQENRPIFIVSKMY